MRGADVVGVDCGGARGVGFEVLGAGVGYVKGFEIGREFLGIKSVVILGEKE